MSGKCLFLLIIAIFLFSSAAYATVSSMKGKTTQAVSREEVSKRLESLNVPFVENKGQVHEDVSFYARTFGGTVFITKAGELVYSLPVKDGNSVSPERGKVDVPSTGELKGVTLRERLMGAEVKRIKAGEEAPTRVSYFIGSDPTRWKSSLTTYRQVSLGEVYDGIELRLRAYGNNVEKLFYVSPGADPSLIRIALCGAKGIKINESGRLEAETGLGGVDFTRPVAWQEIEGKRVPVAVEYSIEDSGPGAQAPESGARKAVSDPGVVYGFKVAAYDRGRELVIDPLLASTFIGGSGDDEAQSLAFDSSGRVYVTGYTRSINYPITIGAYGTSHNGSWDVFVSRLDANLSTLQASTFIGGGSDDKAFSLALDSLGRVYVTGLTWSTDYLTTTGAYDTSHNGGPDVFVSRLDADLTHLQASTFIGGGGNDEAFSLALDSSGRVYVTGWTSPGNYPTTTGAYDRSYNGSRDVFVSRLDANLSTLQASTFIGGGSGESGYSLALDSAGRVYVTGQTSSGNYPTTPGAYDTSHNGSWDVFVSRLDADLSTVEASTFIGGEDYDDGSSLALDSSGRIYVAGETESTEYPTTTGAYDTSHNGGPDVFVSRLDANLTTLQASTFIGGGDDDYGHSLALDSAGRVYIAGETESTEYPTTPGAYDTSHNGGSDVFVSRLDANLTTLQASTFIGGGDGDYGSSLALDGSGRVYVTGTTYSTDYPTKPRAYDTSYNGDGDVFVSRLDADLAGAFPWPLFTPAFINKR